MRDGFLAVFVGILAVIQARINSQLAVDVGSGFEAAAVSFGSGLVLIAVIVLIKSDARAGVSRLRRALARQSQPRLPRWALFGGVGGAMFVASQGLSVPTLGVALYTVAVVAGLTGNSLVADRLGVGPGGRRAVTWPRVAAAIMCLGGVALAVQPELARGDLSIPLVVIAMFAGALVAFQQGFNGRVSVAAGTPLVAALVNFIVGFTVLALITMSVEALDTSDMVLPPAPWSDPVIWLGGPIGVAFVTVASFAVKSLGVLLFSLLTIVGQLVGGLVVDYVSPTSGLVALDWQVVAAVGLSILAAALAFLGSRRV